MQIAVPLDPSDLSARAQQAGQVLGGVQGLVVTSANLTPVTELLRGVVKAKDDLETQRKAITQPINQGLKQVNDLFRPAREALEQTEQALKRAIGAYTLQAKQEQDRLFQAAALAANQGNTQALTQALQASVQAAPVKAEGTSYRARWVPEVRDPSLVPRHLCVPDLVAIRALSAGCNAACPPEAVPGVVWTLDSTVSVRR